MAANGFRPAVVLPASAKAKCSPSSLEMLRSPRDVPDVSGAKILMLAGMVPKHRTKMLRLPF